MTKKKKREGNLFTYEDPSFRIVGFSRERVFSPGLPPPHSRPVSSCCRSPLLVHRVNAVAKVIRRLVLFLPRPNWTSPAWSSKVRGARLGSGGREAQHAQKKALSNNHVYVCTTITTATHTLRGTRGVINLSGFTGQSRHAISTAKSGAHLHDTGERGEGAHQPLSELDSNHVAKPSRPSGDGANRQCR